MNEACTCMLLRSASRRLTAIYDAALAPAGVTVAQFSLLRRISRGVDRGVVPPSPSSLTDIARSADLDRSTVGRNVRVLERLGLVTFVIGADQREAGVVLTDAGRDRLARSLPLWEAVQARVSETVGPGAAHLHALLEAL